MTTAQTKARRRQARTDPRYKGQKKGVSGAATRARRIERAQARAAREGRSYGYSKK